MILNLDFVYAQSELLKMLVCFMDLSYLLVRGFAHKFLMQLFPVFAIWTFFIKHVTHWRSQMKLSLLISLYFFLLPTLSPHPDPTMKKWLSSVFRLVLFLFKCRSFVKIWEKTGSDRISVPFLHVLITCFPNLSDKMQKRENILNKIVDIVCPSLGLLVNRNCL